MEIATTPTQNVVLPNSIHRRFVEGNQMYQTPIQWRLSVGGGGEGRDIMASVNMPIMIPETGIEPRATVV